MLVAKLWVGVGADTREAETALGKFSNSLAGYGKRMADAGKQMSLLITVPLVAAGKKATDFATEYSRSMNILQTVTDASGKEMANLDRLAKALGADLSLPGTSAADASEAMVELAKAGLDVNQVMAASRGVLQLSAAGNLSNAAAAEVAANALNMFKLKGEDATRVADLLAAGANRSSAEVVDMADALKMSGSVFAAAQMPVEDLVTAIAEMANAGIKGSDAGTSLKQMLLSLQAPSEKAKGLMEELGISVYDAEGKMRPMHDLVGIFTDALGDLSQEQRNAALATIFGSDAVRAANIVMMGGVDAFDEMKTAVTKEGAAADLAAGQMQGLYGAIEGMKSALETAALAAGQAAAGPIMDLAKGITDAATAFSELSPEAQEGWVKIAMGAALVGPTLTVVGNLVKAFSGLPALIGAAKTALVTFNTTSALLSGSAPLTAALTAGFGATAVAVGAVAIAAVAAGAALYKMWELSQQVAEGGQDVKQGWQGFFDEQVQSGKSAATVLAEYKKKQDLVNQSLKEGGPLAQMALAGQEDEIRGFDELSTALARTTTSYDSYVRMMNEGAQAGGVYFDEMTTWTDGVNTFSGAVNYLTEAEWQAISGADGMNVSNMALLNQMPSLSEAIETTAAANETLTVSAVDAKLAEEKLFEEMVRGAEATRGSLGGMIAQYDTLTAKMDSWVKDTASQVVGMLGDKFSEASGKYRDALAEVDAIMGTNYTKQLEQKDALGDLVTEYGKTGNLDAFKEGLQRIKDEGLADMQTQLEEVVTKAGELYDKLLALPTEIKIHIGFTADEVPSWVPSGGSGGGGTSTGGGSGGGTYVSEDGTAIGFASGVTDFVVPPGYPNDSYRVGLTSGEHVTVTPDGTTGGITIGELNLYSNAQDADELYREFINRLRQEERGRANAGAGYAGR